VSLNVLLYADDVVIIQKHEDDLQRLVHHLNQICKQYNFKISKEKAKVMAFWGNHPVRSKIVLQDQLLEQVSYLNYLGCEISKENDKCIDKKLGRFQMLCCTVHRTLKNKTRKETRLKFYKTMAIPALMYESEIWVSTKKVQTRIQSTEMNFLWKTKGCTKLDHVTNEMITELNIYPVNDTVEQYRNNWLQHINRMQDTITEKSTSVQTFRKERYRKTKEKMARCSVKTEQANA
jgi:hypothetical protein